jgi:hypothetical protein
MQTTTIKTAANASKSITIRKHPPQAPHYLRDDPVEIPTGENGFPQGSLPAKTKQGVTGDGVTLSMQKPQTLL